MTFREGFESALILSIIFAYLIKTNRKSLTKYVWVGTSVAIGASLILGISIWVVYRVLSEPVQVLFEGLAALLAVVVLSSMIFWLATKGTAIKKEIESRVESVITGGTKFALASFAFVAVFREALETVLFLTPFLSSQFLDTLIGAVLGILASTVLSYGVFAVGMRIDVRRFFFVTSVMLVLLAGGLAGYGVHELIEYSEFTGYDLGWLGRRAYDLLFLPATSFTTKDCSGLSLQ